MLRPLAPAPAVHPGDSGRAPRARTGRGNGKAVLPATLEYKRRAKSGFTPQLGRE